MDKFRETSIVTLHSLQQKSPHDFMQILHGVGTLSASHVSCHRQHNNEHPFTGAPPKPLTDGHGGSGRKRRPVQLKKETVLGTAKYKKLIELHCDERGEGRVGKRRKSWIESYMCVCVCVCVCVRERETETERECVCEGVKTEGGHCMILMNVLENKGREAFFATRIPSSF